jgi:hypothetical protein
MELFIITSNPANSSVGIAKECAGIPERDFQKGQLFFLLYYTAARPAHRPTQSTVKLVPVDSLWGLQGQRREAGIHPIYCRSQ